VNLQSSLYQQAALFNCKPYLFLTFFLGCLFYNNFIMKNKIMVVVPILIILALLGVIGYQFVRNQLKSNSSDSGQGFGVQTKDGSTPQKLNPQNLPPPPSGSGTQGGYGGESNKK
jgi:hypothetical protein